MVRYALTTGLFIITLLGSSNARADNSADTCNGCSVQQVESVAENRTVLRTKTVFVFDYWNSVAWECSVYHEREFNENFASCGHASSAVQGMFDDVVGYVTYLNNEVSLPYGSGDIYEISGCPACARGWLLDNQHSLQNQLDAIDLLAAAGYRLAGTINVWVGSVTASYEGQVRVKIVLANDSSAGREKGYCLGYLTGSELVVNVNQCVDSDGNPIPTLEAPNVQRHYVFTSLHNHRSMINALRAIGRPVMYVGTVTVGPLKMDCTGEGCKTPEPEDENDDE